MIQASRGTRNEPYKCGARAHGREATRAARPSRPCWQPAMPALAWRHLFARIPLFDFFALRFDQLDHSRRAQPRCAS